MTKGKAEAIVKEFLPPVVLRLIRFFRAKKAIIEGRELRPKWYDDYFLVNEQLRKHYTKSHLYPLWSVIADRIMHAEVKSVLDIGCGPGQLSLLLRDKGIPRYLGFDFSAKQIEWARTICPEFDFIVADAFKTDLFHCHDYDAVVCTEFLEHVESDLVVIGKIRIGTRFYGTVPNFPHKSHVRYFMSTQEVYDRYAKYFQAFSLDTVIENTKGTMYYLMEGIKR